MIDPTEVQIYHSFTKVSNYIRVTHIPTGRTAEAQGDDYGPTKWEAMRALEEKLNADKNPPAPA